jgi:hypothetical protein
MGFHGALIGFVHITNTNYVPHKLPFHKRNTPSLGIHASLHHVQGRSPANWLRSHAFWA